MNLTFERKYLDEIVRQNEFSSRISRLTRCVPMLRLLTVLFLACSASAVGQVPTAWQDDECGRVLQPLEGAIMDHNVDKAKHIIESNRATILKRDCGPVALTTSVMHADLEITKALVVAGVDPATDHRSLFLAASHCRDDIALFLLIHGAKIRTTSPLIESVRSCPDGRMATLLIRAGANVNARDSTGSTPLDWAADGNEKLVYLLVAAGADVHARDKNGRTAIDVARDIRDGRKPEHDRIYQFLSQIEELDKRKRKRPSNQPAPKIEQ